MPPTIPMLLPGEFAGRAAAEVSVFLFIPGKFSTLWTLTQLDGRGRIGRFRGVILSLDLIAAKQNSFVHCLVECHPEISLPFVVIYSHWPLLPEKKEDSNFSKPANEIPPKNTGGDP